MQFKSYLKIEWIKCRRSHIFWLLLIAPLLVVLSGTGSISRYFTPEYTNAWAAMFIQSALLYAYYLLPFTMIVVSVMIAGKEQVHGGLRKMKSLPLRLSTLALAKFAVLALYLALEILIFMSFFIVVGFTATSAAHISEILPVSYILSWGWKLFITMLPTLAVIWMLTILLKKTVFAVGLNLFLVIPGVLAANTPFWILYPYCYSGYLVSCALHDFMTGITNTAAFPWSLFLGVGTLVFCLSLFLACRFYGSGDE